MFILMMDIFYYYKNHKMRKINHLTLSIIFFVAGILLSWYYRPFIYQHKFFDLHIADTLGNLFAIPSGINFAFYLKGFNQNLKLEIIKAVIIFILYEFIAYWGTFDYYDIIATIISGVGTYFLMKALLKIKKLTSPRELIVKSK